MTSYEYILHLISIPCVLKNMCFGYAHLVLWFNDFHLLRRDSLMVRRAPSVDYLPLH